MKPKINLRLCVAGAEELLPQFERCLSSYLKYFDIGELLIYTTQNLYVRISETEVFIEQVGGKVDEITIVDMDKFYSEYFDKFPESVKKVMEFSKGKKFKANLSMFYMRMRIVMDYYLVAGRKPFILSDLDIEIHENIQPIIDWMATSESPEGYILYNADYYDEYYHHSRIIRSHYGDAFFEQIPKFNSGWMCVPKGINPNMEEAFDVLSTDINNCPAEMAAVAVTLINNKIKTKLLPRSLMVVDGLDSGVGKTLAHLGPYGL